MKQIFEKVSLGNLKIKNRLVRSATFENGCGNNGCITPALTEVYNDLAKGGVGLIITGMMSAAHNGGVSDNMIQIYDSSFVDQFKKISEDVHKLVGDYMAYLVAVAADANSNLDEVLGVKSEITLGELRKKWAGQEYTKILLFQRI